MEVKKRSKARHVMARLRAMQVGDIISFPLEWMDTVRVQASRCNLLNGGKRSTFVSHNERSINVKRVE